MGNKMEALKAGIENRVGAAFVGLGGKIVHYEPADERSSGSGEVILRKPFAGEVVVRDFRNKGVYIFKGRQIKSPCSY
ncbi:hypothetical protein C4559_04190 [Candidatus Microgenomates bacterium]|nr:MAG: hypothetical protein C4559_04190 [Candidatus Microgenomates bacterium]